MSFEKAQQLLDLATFVASHRLGVTLDDVGERFGISRRTAQRLMHALEAQFPETESGFDQEGHKRWRLQTGALRDLLTLTADELAALDLGIGTLARNALGVEAIELRRLREKIMTEAALLRYQQLVVVGVILRGVMLPDRLQASPALCPTPRH